MNHLLQVFHGELDSHTAQVYVKWAECSHGELSLRGHVRGPFTARARTLPATFTLHDLGPGPSLLARAIISDPCFWTPGLRFHYEIVAEVCRGTEVIARGEQILGLRHLGLLRGQLCWERQAWTLIGCRDETSAEVPWSAWREQQVVRVVAAPSESVCHEASQEGVALVAHLEVDTKARSEIEHETRRLGKWPAVALVLISGEVGGDLSLRDAAPNCLLAAEWEPGRIWSETPWAQLAVVSCADRSASAAMVPPPVPWIALLPHSTVGPLEQRVVTAREWVAQLSQGGSCVGCIV